MKTVIIAAGTGSRIKDKTNDTPKTLLPYGNETILSTILNNFAKSGIHDFVIVVGYKSELIKEYIEKNNNFGYNISYFLNHEWQRGNGISVLLAEEATMEENFILTMSDHIVSEGAIKKIITSKNNTNLLLVDPQINEIFDIDDATKVQTQAHQIINIGKEIKVYNGIDCGVFRLNSDFYNAMRIQLNNGKESISEAIKILIKNNDMNAVFTTKEDYWLDIDTPQAYNHGLKKFIIN